MKSDTILLDHGSGGKISHDFVTETLVPLFDNPMLSQLHDGATVTVNGTRLAFSTDSFVVDPIFFPGGNIGDLAVNGTVNDLAMCGAIPRYLSAGLIIEEGFPMASLRQILTSMKVAAKTAGVHIVTGDTKVVPRGAADKIFINTAGIGEVPKDVTISGDRARPEDCIILSGTLADHGMTVLNQRENLAFESQVASDTAALNHLVAKMLAVCPDIHVLRDPTRGGLATALNEVAMAAGVGIEIQEGAIPIKSDVAGMCGLLGIDPLYVANEGKLFAMVPAASVEAVLDCMRKDPLGKAAAIIGAVVTDHPASVYMKTEIGGTRIVQMLAGDQLPRIC